MTIEDVAAGIGRYYQTLSREANRPLVNTIVLRILGEINDPQFTQLVISKMHNFDIEDT